MFLAPFHGYGGGNYKLTSVTEVKVTEEFLGFDEETKKCQNKTRVHDCQQEKFLFDFTQKCQCIPYHLKNYSLPFQVGFIPMFSFQRKSPLKEP